MGTLNRPASVGFYTAHSLSQPNYFFKLTEKLWKHDFLILPNVNMKRNFVSFYCHDDIQAFIMT